MSPLYVFNQKLLVSYGALAASQNCCCESSSSSSSSYNSGSSSGYGPGPGECGDCYRLDFNWEINDCDGNPYTISGTLLMSSGGIQCYSCADATSVTSTDLNFNNLCGEGTYSYLSIYCSTGSTLVYGYIDSSPFPSYVFGFVPANLCCTNSGSYQVSADDNSSTVYIAMSTNNSGECDCAGYNII